MKITGLAKVYGDLIIKKKRTYDEVPARLKDQVKAYLESKGYNTDGEYVGDDNEHV